MNKDLKRIEKEARRALVKMYRASLDKIRIELMRIEEKFIDGNNTPADRMRYAREMQLQESIAAELKTLGQNVQSYTAKLKIETHKEAYLKASFDIDKQTGFVYSLNETTFANIPKAAAAKLAGDEKFLLACRDLDAKTAREVKQTIGQGIITGDATAKISKTIQKNLEFSTARAMRIARTETARAYNAGELDATTTAENAGISLIKVWLSTKDDRTRDSHREMDGQEADENGYFTIPATADHGDLLCECPHDDNLPASEVVNCRCTFFNKVEGYEPKTMSVRSDSGKSEIVQYKNYQDWAKDKLK